MEADHRHDLDLNTRSVLIIYGSNLCEYPCQHKGSNRGTPVQTLSNVQLGPESTGLAWAYQAVKGP
jgi:hypothetical protein